jgi:thioredoxin-like negative regulator of GroEL
MTGPIRSCRPPTPEPVPTLILIKGTRAVARLEGKARAAEIEELVDRHLDGGIETGPEERP